ncbi:hypothetical protein U9M48_035848 [Paspalum notatum var. saurae]|uniref:Uncharacterized protein n=1 Tax=Paspalum notatum var. saurae TaxID=547442 RepID=A0AAQ3X8U6_PASNO
MTMVGSMSCLGALIPLHYFLLVIYIPLRVYFELYINMVV